MYVMPVPNSEHRKTAYDLTLVEYGGVLVSVDSRLPNRLVGEAIDGGRLPEFTGYPDVASEMTFHNSRIDLMLSGPPGKLYVETKSVNLVQEGIALFPDAPTERGRKHLLSLIRSVDEGYQAAAVFVVQRPDAERFSPYRDADPPFAVTLRQAADRGVQVIAYRCNVSLTEIAISDRIPVAL